MNILSEYVRLVRADLELTEEAAAERVRALTGKPFKPERIRQIELGMFAPTATTIETVAKALGFTPNDFFARAVELWRKEQEEP